MIIFKKLKLSSILIVLIIVLQGLVINFNEYNDSFNDNNINIQAVDRTGKLFTNITRLSSNCFISREQEGLNIQPDVYIPDYILSHANMQFENIKAINYTKDIETDMTDFIYSSIHGPIYFYQIFSVELSQYVNNVSIFMQDINNPTEYTDENSWDVAIVNCSNDNLGTPNQNETLGVLQKPHPIVYAAHWEVFDFKNSEIGPIYLDTSKTNWTIEEGLKKYWFALRIKIPPDDSHTGGGPKFLYFSPDGEDTNNKGEGDTFAINPNFFTDKYCTNHAVENKTLWGNHTHYNQGNLSSFEAMDENRYYVDSNYTGTENAIAVDIKINVEELTGYGITFEDIADPIKREEMDWRSEHYRYISSFNISFAVNLSSTENIDVAVLVIKKGVDFQFIDNNITQSTEDLTSKLYSNSWEKLEIIENYMNFTDNNSLSFRFYVYGDTVFNLTINQLTVETRELPILDTIVPHDPLILDLNYSNNVTVENGTANLFTNDALDALNTIDENRYNVKADTDNVSIEFKLNVLNNIDSSLFDVDDLNDWLFNQPNPIVPQIDFRITSNVSIQDKSNLSLSVLEVYKGNKNITYFTEEQNSSSWIMLSDFNNSYAFNQETTNLTTIDPFRTWIFMQLINTSDGNSLRFRLRYVGNETFQNFNVSINEFLLIIYVQNAISSDICSTIGFGINSNTLKPSDIKMQNFGQDITDNGFRNGIWEADIDDGTPFQGYFTFNISSLWPSISFNVNGTYEIYQVLVLIEFIDTPSNQYETGYHPFSVRVTGGNGTSLENLDIIFEILDSNSAIISDTTARTNREGIASANLDFSTTGDKYLIRVRFVQDGIYLSSEIQSENIRVVNDLILSIEYFLQLLPYILAILSGLFIFIAIRYQKHKKLERVWSAEAMILDDLVNISYIMIIHKEVGVSIYNKQTALEGLDSDLISGFLQAISQFRHEFTKGTKDLQSSKGFEMDYYDFKIIIVDGDFARVALILDKSPSDQLKLNQTAFTNAFEVKFRPYLERFTGDISPFRETDSLIEKYFNITLMYPLKLATYRDVFKLNHLEKVLVEVAEQIQKERKFFFVSSLLSFGIAGRKESRDQIISSILSLKNKGILVPVEIK